MSRTETSLKLGRSVHVRFVCAPWPPLRTPSMALSLFEGHLLGKPGVRSVGTRYSHLRWYDYLSELLGSFAAIGAYNSIASAGSFDGVADLAFRQGGEDSPVTDDEIAAVVGDTVEPAVYHAIIRHAHKFASREAADLAETLPEGSLVGFTLTYAQLAASMAIGEVLRQLRPDCPQVVGGAGMTHERAQVLLMSFPWLDFIVVGDGEDAILSLVRAIGREQSATHPNIVARGLPPAEETCSEVVDMGSIALPRFDSYFGELGTTGLASQVSSVLVAEIARGCWWGAKRHCTFCGLNPSGMEYRRGDIQAVYEHTAAELTRWGTRDLVIVDNILRESDVSEFYEPLARLVPDLGIHIECRASLSRDVLTQLRESGVASAQPGIESLSRRALALMRKGTTPVMAIRFLRNAAELSLYSPWNVLSGFPGETWDDHKEYLAQLQNLFHLLPPSSVGRISLARHSPLFETYGDDALVRPGWALAFSDLSAEDQKTLADVLEWPDLIGLDVEETDRLVRCFDAWKDSHDSVRLWQREEGTSIVAWKEIDKTIAWTHVIAPSGWTSDAWQLMRSGSTTRRLASELAPQTHQEALEQWLGELLDLGVVFRSGEEWVTLPIDRDSYDHYQDQYRSWGQPHETK